MRIHVLQHAAAEGPADIATWAYARGYPVSTTRLDLNESLPNAGNVDLAVVMGGPMNVHQYRDFPWLRAERRFLEQFIAGGKSAIGICLGAQLLADALGARVTQNPVREIGWWPVRFTAEARERFPELPPTAEFLHWHGDTFELPADAIRLAASNACPEQGFLYDDRILGLQFHPEMTRQATAELVEAERAALTGIGSVQSPEKILTAPDAHYASATQILNHFLNTLFPA